MHRVSLASQYAVSCTLLLMITDNRTDHRHRVVLKKFFPCIHDFVFFEHLDDVRDRCMHRTSLLTHWFLTVQAAVCLIDNMQTHFRSPSSMITLGKISPVSFIR